MSTAAYVTKADAAALTGKSESTIQRYNREGRLPSSRRRGDGVLEVAVADLVAAGLLDPLAAAGDVDDLAGRTRAERDAAALRTDLAVASARLEEMAERLAQADAEIAFLRGLLAKDAA